ncbi:MAG: hypothetical protein IPK13_08380 [Deltaproteobacteria bacterium]|nr:hypothetical protein [Deltaproteobacteria bacterium]
MTLSTNDVLVVSLHDEELQRVGRYVAPAREPVCERELVDIVSIEIGEPKRFGLEPEREIDGACFDVVSYGAKLTGLPSFTTYRHMKR